MDKIRYVPKIINPWISRLLTIKESSIAQIYMISVELDMRFVLIDVALMVIAKMGNVSVLTTLPMLTVPDFTIYKF